MIVALLNHERLKHIEKYTNTFFIYMLQATKELRAMGVNSLIVGVTSRGLPNENQAFMEAGLDYCFEKPLTSDMISFLLQELNKNTNN